MSQNFEPFTYNASLLIHSKTVALNDIESVLGIHPHVSWRAGDTMSQPTNTRNVRSDNYCCFNFKIELDLPMEDNIMFYIKKFSGSEALIRRIKDDGGSLVLAITWYSGQGRGYEFCSSFLIEIGRLGLDLGIEVF